MNNLTNEQKIEILANRPEITSAVTLMIAAFKEMKLNAYIIIPYETKNILTDEMEVYDIMIMKKNLKEAK